VLAISTDQPTYNPDAEAQVLCLSITNLFSLYDVTDNSNFGEYSCDMPTILILPSISVIGNIYSVLEHDGNFSCSQNDYYLCAAENFIVGEATFNVVDPVPILKIHTLLRSSAVCR